MTDNQLNSVGGVADGALTQDETAGHARKFLSDDESLTTTAQGALNKIDWSTSSTRDVVATTKYPVDAETVYLGSGSLSFNPRLGRFLFGTSTNKTAEAALKIDQSASVLRSNLTNITFGSINIDTVDGYKLNKIGAKYPSTHFTPEKLWVRSLFPSFDDNLLKISMLEALQAVVLGSLKGTKSEQILRENQTDLASVILSNQDIEDKILKDARS